VTMEQLAVMDNVESFLFCLVCDLYPCVSGPCQPEGG
jgi:hypothetical protein